MQATLGGDIYLGAEASEAQVYSLNQSQKLAQARVIAFATHGLLYGDFGLSEPALALSPPASLANEDRQANDGLLTASEIATLSLNADWIVLSACNTGGGSNSLSGLARAFFYAGARSLLISYWRVRDDTAARLTTGTLQIQARHPNLSRAEALRQAQLSLLDDRSADRSAEPYSDPAVWPAFSLIGD